MTPLTHIRTLYDALEVWDEWALELAELDAHDAALRAVRQLEKHLKDALAASSPDTGGVSAVGRTTKKACTGAVFHPASGPLPLDKDSAVESEPHSPPATTHPPLPAKEDPAPSKATAETTP